MTAEAWMMTDTDFRLYLSQRFQSLEDGQTKLRLDIREGAQGIHQRLDVLNGRMGKAESRLAELERRDAVQEGERRALDGRLQPTRDGKRAPGDEELRIAVTPKMWGALVGVGTVLYTLLHLAFDYWRGTHP